MKLSNKGEYACLALIHLAERYRDGLCRIEDIASEKKIPKKFLEQILLSLKYSGYVRSHRGPAGGYELAKRPDQISLAEIIRLMDGALAPTGSVSTHFYNSTPLEQSPKVSAVMKELRDYISDKLEHTFFSDLL
jgi:Rrf2 family transcriptional regulator, cysteine metabolism repressor